MVEKHTTNEKSTLKADISNEEATELERIMLNAFAGNPFLPPTAAATMLSFIIGELRKSASANKGENNAPEWGTVGQVAKIYNYSSDRMDDYLVAWAAQGKVRTINPTDPKTGRRGHTRYNLEDVRKLMAA